MSTHNRVLPRALPVVLRAAMTTLIVILLSGVVTTVASAHTALIATDPADHSTLPTAPARVSATFNEELQPQFAAMTIVGPDGNLWPTGAPEVHGAVISVSVPALGPAGAYTVNYRVTSADGHVVSGAWSFTLTEPGPGTPGPTAEPAPQESGLPVWPFLAGAAVLIAAGAVWAVRRRT